MSKDVIVTEKQEKNYIITINRDEKRNAINLDVYYGLRDALLSVYSDPSIRSIIIRGEGKGFSAGIDFNFLASIGIIDGSPPYAIMRIKEGQDIFNLIDDIEKPVIFAIHNYCFGAALELVLTGDFRIAEAGTKFGIQETAVGFIPDMGGIARLTHLLGPILAKELIMTAKKIDAEEAKEMGLVNNVVDDAMEGALALASELNKNAPLAIGIVKKLINRCQHMDIRTFMEMEAIGQITVCSTDDAKEGVAAKLQRREPNFQGK
jgi:enoyl-CoA hydratase/carnithine racemase